MQNRQIRFTLLAMALGVVALVGWSVLTVMPAAGAPAATFGLRQVAQGFAAPVYLTHAGDGSGRLFVVEKGGTIRIIQNGQVLAQPFLDISDRVGNDGEAGLLSIAFPPDYATSGYFFVYYNHADKNLVGPEPEDGGSNGGYDTVVARFRVTTDPNRADKNSEERILVRNQPFTNHNGGLVKFGPDGYLYIGLGDGGSGGDPYDTGQNVNSLLGKMLRISVGASGTYTIPPTNPFVNQPGARGEIWDWGLRNPWRYSFDRQTGDLLIGDVGQSKYEEISLHPAGTPGGLNFGWDCFEGNTVAPDERALHWSLCPACAGLRAWRRPVGDGRLRLPRRSVVRVRWSLLLCRFLQRGESGVFPQRRRLDEQAPGAGYSRADRLIWRR